MEDKPIYGQCPFCGGPLTTAHTMVCQGWKENSIESMEDQLSSAKDRIMDLEEALKEEVETNEQQAELIGRALEVVRVVASHEGMAYFDVFNHTKVKAQALIPALETAMEKVK